MLFDFVLIKIKIINLIKLTSHCGSSMLCDVTKNHQNYVFVT